MRRILTLSILAGACALVASRAATAEDETKSVEVKDITLKVPADWKQTKPKSRLRLAQFAIPAAEGVKTETELVVYSFPGGGGGVGPNVKRWINQFEVEGRESKVTSGKANGNAYYVADLTGTYNMPVGPPILRKTKPLPKARMLAAIVVLEGKGVYYLKMAGPQKTVDEAAKAFRASFGGDAEKEQPWEPES